MSEREYESENENDESLAAATHTHPFSWRHLSVDPPEPQRCDVVDIDSPAQASYLWKGQLFLFILN